MLNVFRHLMRNDEGALTPKYTVISCLIASLVALSAIAIKLTAVPVRAAGM